MPSVAWPETPRAQPAPTMPVGRWPMPDGTRYTARVYSVEHIVSSTRAQRPGLRIRLLVLDGDYAGETISLCVFKSVRSDSVWQRRAVMQLWSMVRRASADVPDTTVEITMGEPRDGWPTYDRLRRAG